MTIPGTDPDDDFFEEDEPLEDIVAAWERSVILLDESEHKFYCTYAECDCGAGEGE